MNHAQTESVLIVDDIPDNRKLLRDLLKAEGYRILVAENGNKALERVARARPSLILLDIMMPEMDGYEVCRRLKQNAVTAEIPVIFITGKDDKESLVNSFAVGGVDYITKPLNPSEVLARVKTHLRLNRVTKELFDKNNDLEKQVSELKAANEQLRQEIGFSTA
jgi:PleD family two-component response regulator